MKEGRGICMIVNKGGLLIGALFVLSGCTTLPEQASVPKDTDYGMFCKVDMDEVVEGNYLVKKIDQRFFYITSNGNVYSKNELDNLKLQQQENNNRPLTEQVQSKFKSIVNGIAGINIMHSDNIDKTDVNTAKRIVVRKFISVDHPSIAYCTAKLESSDQPEKFTTKMYKMVVKKANETNIDIYNNNGKDNIFLTPLY